MNEQRLKKQLHLLVLKKGAPRDKFRNEYGPLLSRETCRAENCSSLKYMGHGVGVAKPQTEWAENAGSEYCFCLH